MSIEQLKSLTEDELAMLWYIVNKLENPVTSGVEIDWEVFTSIDSNSLLNRVINAEKLIKDEYKNIFSSLSDKLKVK